MPAPVPRGSGSGFWDRLAGRYDRQWLQRAILQPTRARVLRRFEELGLRPGRLLDVGCGTGQFAAEFAARYPDSQVTACDTSDCMLERARQRCAGRTVRFVAGPVARVPPAARFDAVVCLHALPYLSDPAADLREMRGRLAEAGRLFIVSASRETRYDRLALGGLARLVGHARYPGMAEIGTLLSQAGLVRAHTERLDLGAALPSIRLVEAIPAAAG